MTEPAVSRIPQRYDLLFHDVLLVDGTGAPATRGDLAVHGDRIAAVGALDTAEAAEVIHASSLALAPGFIDMHSHADLSLLVDPAHVAKVAQGVTTELLGQDGLSYAPASAETLAILRRHLAGLYGDPPGLDWSWRSVADYLARLDRRVSVNTVYLAPHAAVRAEIVGMADRRPTRDETARMARVVAEAIRDGAAGFSTGLTYAPGCYADTAEVVELCRAVAAEGGIYVTHIRGYLEPLFGAIDEAFAIGRAAGVPVHISHLQATGPFRGRAREVLARVDSALAEGLDVSFDSYPYVAGSGPLTGRLPTWMHDGGPDALVARLRDPAVRAQLHEHYRKRPFEWERHTVCSVRFDRYRAFEGASLAAFAQAVGKHPLDAMCDLLIEEDLAVSIMNFQGDEGGVRALMTHGRHMVGSDGLHIGSRPNPRTYGTFPRYLGRYTRELGILRLEEAIHKMTGLPARRLGLADRGELRAGFAADLVLFDPSTVRDEATYEEPRRLPLGIRQVFVNGRRVYADGRTTGMRAGRALRPTAAPRLPMP